MLLLACSLCRHNVSDGKWQVFLPATSHCWSSCSCSLVSIFCPFSRASDRSSPSLLLLQAPSLCSLLLAPLLLVFMFLFMFPTKLLRLSYIRQNFCVASLENFAFISSLNPLLLSQTSSAKYLPDEVTASFGTVSILQNLFHLFHIDVFKTI